jgi:ABC-type Fe3+/spermidine/putrescine transport system ATPase subunit
MSRLPHWIKKLRTKTQLELTSLQKQLEITFVFVTHDQEEAMSLSDRMAIMKNGNILECSSPEEIYENPKSIYTANFVGIANIFELKKKNENYFSDELNAHFEINKNELNENCNILLRPEKIKIIKKNNTDMKNLNSVEGTILEKSYLGSFTRYEVKCNEKIVSVIDQNYNDNANYNFPVGEQVICSWSKESVKILED